MKTLIFIENAPKHDRFPEIYLVGLLGKKGIYFVELILYKIFPLYSVPLKHSYFYLNLIILIKKFFIHILYTTVYIQNSMIRDYYDSN